MGCANSKGGGDPHNDGEARTYLAGNDPNPEARKKKIEEIRATLGWELHDDGTASRIVLKSAWDRPKILTRADVIDGMMALMSVASDMYRNEFEDKIRGYDDSVKEWMRSVFGKKCKDGDDDDANADEGNGEAQDESTTLPLEQRLIKRYKPMLRGTRPTDAAEGPAPTWWSAVPFGGATLNDAAFAYTHMNSGASEFLTLVPATNDGALPLHYGIGDADVAPMLPEGATLASLLAEKRLFVCDFSQLLVAHTKPEINQELYDVGIRAAPIALFWVDGAGALMPLAIRLFPATAAGAEEDPVFTPASHGATPAWSAAKLFVNNAAVAVHTANEHIKTCDIFALAIGAALVRNVAETHPVVSAIGPFFNQFWALQMQFLAGPKIDLGRDWIHQISTVWALTFDWHAEYDHKQRYADRGLDLLGEAQCPHGSDMAKLHGIYEDFAAGVVAAVYADDAAVKADAELQAMAKDLTAEDGGRLRGTTVTPQGTFETREQVSKLLASFAFFLSAGHGADVSDFGWYAWIPAEPLNFKLDPPRSSEAAAAITDDAIVAALADPGSSEAQMQVMGIMAAYQNRAHSRLTTGGGPETAASVPETPHWLRNHDGFEAVRTQWYTALDGLEKAIVARNAAVANAPGKWPCFQMKPTNVSLSLWQ